MDESIFHDLKSLLIPYAKRLVVTIDSPTQYMLFAKRPLNGKALLFGGVAARKGYTGYYFFPRYMFTELDAYLSQRLIKSSGKSCINIKRLDEATLTSLRELTKAGFDRYEAEGLL